MIERILIIVVAAAGAFGEYCASRHFRIVGKAHQANACMFMTGWLASWGAMEGLVPLLFTRL